LWRRKAPQWARAKLPPHQAYRSRIQALACNETVQTFRNVGNAHHGAPDKDVSLGGFPIRAASPSVR
jgi:hypothetical protein